MIRSGTAETIAAKYSTPGRLFRTSAGQHVYFDDLTYLSKQ